MMEREDLQRLDLGFTMSVATLVEALGMHWENEHRIQCGRSIAYGEKEFQNLLDRNQCNWNDSIGRWMR